MTPTWKAVSGDLNALPNVTTHKIYGIPLTFIPGLEAYRMGGKPNVNMSANRYLAAIPGQCFRVWEGLLMGGCAPLSEKRK